MDFTSFPLIPRLVNAVPPNLGANLPAVLSLKWGMKKSNKSLNKHSNECASIIKISLDLWNLGLIKKRTRFLTKYHCCCYVPCKNLKCSWNYRWWFLVFSLPALGVRWWVPFHLRSGKSENVCDHRKYDWVNGYLRCGYRC